MSFGLLNSLFIKYLSIINFIKYSSVVASPKAIKAYLVCKNNIHGIMAIHTATKALMTKNFDFPWQTQSVLYVSYGKSANTLNE